MNPPIIDILRQQRNVALDELANALANLAERDAEIERLKAELVKKEEKQP